jgi:hypothetical protein
MKRDHEQVLLTMFEAGLLTRQSMKSIRGQLMSMTDNERESYLRKLIKRKGGQQ